MRSMAEDRFLWAEYCDDIRQEVGSKISLIGCYGSELHIGAPLPVVLPKLCTFVRARTPLERPFKAGVLRIYRDERPIVEMPVDPKEAVETPPEGAKWQLLSAVLVMSPFQVEAPCVLRVVFETEGQEIEGPKLRVRDVTAAKGAPQ